MSSSLLWLCWADPDHRSVACRSHTFSYIPRQTVTFPPQTRSQLKVVPDPLHLGDESEFAHLHVARRKLATHTDPASRPSRHRPGTCFQRETPPSKARRTV